MSTTATTPSTRTLTLLVAELGRHDDEYEMFLTKREKLLDIIIERGSRQITLTMTLLEVTTVTSKERQLHSIEDMDEHVELEYYKTRYRGGLGDPLINGFLGHIFARVDGVLGVVVPSEPIKKRKRARQGIVDINRTHDDGSLKISDDQHSVIANRDPCVCARPNGR